MKNDYEGKYPCMICGGPGWVKSDTQNKYLCQFCYWQKRGKGHWIELLGGAEEVKTWKLRF